MWDREGISEETSAQVIPFSVKDVSNNKNPIKVWKFVAFSCFVKNILKRNKYEKVIFLGTQGCAVSFCAPFLKKHYYKKMWIDIRDDEYEWFPPFYWGEKLSIEASYATAISSYEYRSFLPIHDYLNIHNIDPYYDRMQLEYKPIADPENRIRISFIGNVRYFEQNQILLKYLGNDKRFCLQYFGKGSEIIEKYCKDNDIRNVEFAGAFPQKDTMKFYNRTDIINNAYGNSTLNLKAALSNKLYYALFLQLPILVSSNTLMAYLTKQYGIGYTFEERVTFADDLEKWYRAIQCGVLQPDYLKLRERVVEEDARCMGELREFLVG
jgi:hypothetical protein